MKPLTLVLASLPLCFLLYTSVPDLWYSPFLTILLVPPVEPPPYSAITIISDVLLALAVICSFISLLRILSYLKKEKPVEVIPGGVITPVKIAHKGAVWLLFITIFLDVSSVISFMFTEPGMRPHPLAEPDRAAPILIADPRTSESLFLLLGIIFASASMLSLFISQQKIEKHTHGWAILFASLCFAAIALGAAHYWFTI